MIDHNPAPLVILDGVFLQDLIETVESVFHDAFAMNVECSSFQFGPNATTPGEVSGVMDIVQDQMEGLLTLSLSKPVAGAVLARVYGRSFSEIDALVADGAKEIANMIYGKMKTRLNERGHNLKMSLPSVINGAGRNLRSHPNCVNLTTTFTLENHTFHVMITLQDQPAKERAAS